MAQYSAADFKADYSENEFYGSDPKSSSCSREKKNLANRGSCRNLVKTIPVIRSSSVPQLSSAVSRNLIKTIPVAHYQRKRNIDSDDSGGSDLASSSSLNPNEKTTTTTTTELIDELKYKYKLKDSTY